MNEQLYTSANEWIVASIEYNKRVGGSTVFYKQIDVVVYVEETTILLANILIVVVLNLNQNVLLLFTFLLFWMNENNSFKKRTIKPRRRGRDKSFTLWKTMKNKS